MRILILAMLVSAHAAWAWTADHEAIWDTHAHQWITLTDLADRLAAPGQIVVFGEQHATADNVATPANIIHHDNQVRLLSALHTVNRAPVSVGLEFLNYPTQRFVDQFRAGQLSEEDFLSAVLWARGNPIESYRQQILFAGGGRTLALNIPNAIANAVAKLGPNGLVDEQRPYLPPLWELDNPSYYQRFQDVMLDGHVSPDKLQNFFWAQSLWDDTMAWKAAGLSQDVLVVIVGEFHVAFGGGLPYELRRFTQQPIATLLQIETPDWQDATRSAAVAPDAVYGERADYLWVHSGAH